MSVKPKSSVPISPDDESLPEITDAWIAGADLYHADTLVRRGRPRTAHPRQLLSLRLPAQVIARWKATGPGWQTRMAEALEKTAPKPPQAAD
ncbi:MAG: BrnA antitoxin family protein [Pseudoxanthomonas sp.]